MDPDNVYFNKTALRATQATKPLIYYGKKVSGSGYLSMIYRWISYATKSSDFTPCDFLLWGHVNDKIFANCLVSIEDLKVEIRKAIGYKGHSLFDWVM